MVFGGDECSGGHKPSQLAIFPADGLKHSHDFQLQPMLCCKYESSSSLPQYRQKREASRWVPFT
jgi:hypothetical protein